MCVLQHGASEEIWFEFSCCQHALCMSLDAGVPQCHMTAVRSSEDYRVSAAIRQGSLAMFPPIATAARTLLQQKLESKHPSAAPIQMEDNHMRQTPSHRRATTYGFTKYSIIGMAGYGASHAYYSGLRSHGIFMSSHILTCPHFCRFRGSCASQPMAAARGKRHVLTTTFRTCPHVFNNHHCHCLPCPHHLACRFAQR